MNRSNVTEAPENVGALTEVERSFSDLGKWPRDSSAIKSMVNNGAIFPNLLCAAKARLLLWVYYSHMSVATLGSHIQNLSALVCS